MNDKNNALHLGFSKKSFISISHCKFDIEKNAKTSSLLFINSHGTKEVKECIFTGKLTKGTYHIDTKAFNSVRVDSCKFSSGMKQAFNANVIKDESNNQAFNESLLNSTKLWFTVAAFGIVCCAVIAALVFKRRGEIEATENHEVSLASIDTENKL